MPKPILTAIAIGGSLALLIFGMKFTPPAALPTAMPANDSPLMMDSRYAGLPTSESSFAPHGYLYVVEPPPTWNPTGDGVRYPICPRPQWCPYTQFLGPPVPVAAVAIDQTGYMFTTPDGINVHRDGWLVTEDGRAFRAAEKIDQMNFPALPSGPSTTDVR